MDKVAANKKMATSFKNIVGKQKLYKTNILLKLIEKKAKKTYHTIISTQWHITTRQTIVKFWQLPERFTWMDPLPYWHRRGILFFSSLMLLAFLWPSAGYQPKSQPNEIVHQYINKQNNQQPLTWKHYKVQQGKTLVQLFRDNHLPINEALAMARVEGHKKPLSHLHSGQDIHIAFSADAIISVLTVTMPSGEFALFQRQSDGSYLMQSNAPFSHSGI